MINQAAFNLFWIDDLHWFMPIYLQSSLVIQFWLVSWCCHQLRGYTYYVTRWYQVPDNSMVFRVQGKAWIAAPLGYWTRLVCGIPPVSGFLMITSKKCVVLVILSKQTVTSCYMAPYLICVLISSDGQQQFSVFIDSCYWFWCGLCIVCLESDWHWMVLPPSYAPRLSGRQVCWYYCCTIISLYQPLFPRNNMDH